MGKNLIEIVDSLLVFDFRDDLKMAVSAVENFLDFKEVLLVAYERMCDEIDVGIDCPIKEDAVLFCKRRK